MKQMDRQLLILNRLRAERPLRAADLAEECECSVRTIYRDIESLSAAGIPVAAMPGEGYRLVDGFHLPPIAFTAEEAAQLMRGAELARNLGTEEQDAARRSALSKLEAALPGPTFDEVSRLRERVRTESWPRRRAPSQWLDVLLEATLNDRVVRLRYHSFAGDEVTEREVEPHHLSFYADDWHVRGYCRLRAGGRDFRLSRIRDAEILDEVFERRDLDAQPENGYADSSPLVEVQIWLDSSVLPWAREDPPYGFVSEQPAEGGALFTVRSRDLRRVLPWVLRWGAKARAINPPEVVSALRDESQAMLERYVAP